MPPTVRHASTLLDQPAVAPDIIHMATKPTAMPSRRSGFVILSSFGIRHSSFSLPHADPSLRSVTACHPRYFHLPPTAALPRLASHLDHPMNDERHSWTGLPGTPLSLIL